MERSQKRSRLTLFHEKDVDLTTDLFKFEHFPDEIVLNIFSNVSDPRQLLDTSQLSTRMKLLSQDYSVWKSLMKRKFTAYYRYHKEQLPEWLSDKTSVDAWKRYFWWVWAIEYGMAKYIIHSNIQNNFFELYFPIDVDDIDVVFEGNSPYIFTVSSLHSTHDQTGKWEKLDEEYIPYDLIWDNARDNVTDFPFISHLLQNVYYRDLLQNGFKIGKEYRFDLSKNTGYWRHELKMGNLEGPLGLWLKNKDMKESFPFSIWTLQLPQTLLPCYIAETLMFNQWYDHDAEEGVLQRLLPNIRYKIITGMVEKDTIDTDTDETLTMLVMYYVTRGLNFFKVNREGQSLPSALPYILTWKALKNRFPHRDYNDYTATELAHVANRISTDQQMALFDFTAFPPLFRKLVKLLVFRKSNIIASMLSKHGKTIELPQKWNARGKQIVYTEEHITCSMKTCKQMAKYKTLGNTFYCSKECAKSFFLLL
jgi:hypothetical protein